MLTRRNFIASLSLALGESLVPKAFAQLAGPQTPLSQLPDGAITTIPKPTSNYSGTLLVDLPGKPNIHPKIRATGTHQRYDWALLGFLNFTSWIDLETGEMILKTPGGKPAANDLPLPTHYLGIPMRKSGHEWMFNDMEYATALEVKDAAIMKDRIFTGKFLVLDDGTVVGVSGDEKNTAKNGKFTGIRMKMTEFHRGPQGQDVLPPLPRKRAALALSGP